jgi:hypothetical protein
MSIALHNRVKTLEARIAALEAAFSSLPEVCRQILDSVLLESAPRMHPSEDLKKMRDDIQGLKMRMGKKEFA